MSDLDSCVEVDGAPGSDMLQRFQCMKLGADERVESGFEQSFQSQDADELRKTINERLGGASEGGKVYPAEDKFTRDTSTKDETLYSTDEGYNSQSINELEAARLRTLQHVSQEQETDSLGKVAYCQDEDGDTSLHMAIIQLMEEVAHNCINAAPSHHHLNLVNNLLQTPLHLAVLTKQPTVVRRLMTAGAQVDIRDLNGNTPLHIACREGFQDIVHTLLHPVYYEELQDNTYEIPYQMIPQDLEAKNYEGLTCLHLAAQGGHIAVMTLLLERGANINAQDGKSGRTVLHHAAEVGNLQLLRFLLHNPGTAIDCLTYGGMTPIALAHGRNHSEVVGELRRFGADYESINDFEESDDDNMNGDDMPFDDLCISGRPVW